METQKIINYLKAVCEIPRASKDELKMAEYLMTFAKERGHEAVQDEKGNVVVKVAAVGCEGKEPVILQGHLDMVYVKSEESNHEYQNGIVVKEDEEYLFADGTSLGADNGVALAYCMMLMDSKDVVHPELEMIFTVEEEVGLAGAGALDVSDLKGKYFLNIDGEEEGVFVVGCAGGYICRVHIPFTRVEESGQKVTLAVRGVTGGHSGGEIQHQRENSNKLVGRILYNLSKEFDFNIVNINGGTAANVISMFTTVELIVEPEHVEGLVARFKAFEAVLKDEFTGMEDNLVLEAQCEGEATVQAMDAQATANIISYLFGAPDEVQTYNRRFREYVETSLNTGIVKTEENDVWFEYQIRSDFKSKLDMMKDKMQMWAELVGGWSEAYSDYPAWAYKPDSRLREIMVKKYTEMYGVEPETYITHGGLEGGMFSEKNPDLDIVCFGCNLFDVHSVKERVEIESFARTYEFIKEVLKECK